MDRFPLLRDLLAWVGVGSIACFLLMWIWVVLLEYADRRSRRKDDEL